MNVLHKCDNRVCINPEHLFLGTHDENMSDMTSKERQARGERNGLSKLSNEAVRQIRRDNRPQHEIAADYGVSRSAIGMAKRHVTWRHVP
jgi:hypothetical protein